MGVWSLLSFVININVNQSVKHHKQHLQSSCRLGKSVKMDDKLNVNRYATKKTISKGLLDIALLTSNAAQLKSVLSAGDEYEYYTAAVALIITSIVLQALVGILLLIIGGLDINNEKYHRTADMMNNATTVIIFIITFINVVISAFGLQS